MKDIIFLMAIVFAGCAVNQKNLMSENSAQPIPTQKATVASSSNSLRNDFDKSLPLRVREALENAEEIEILSLDENFKGNSENYEKFYINQFVIFGDKSTKVAKDETRTQLLDTFYEDVKTGGDKAACFTPHHTIKIDYKSEKIAMAICFHCGQFVGVISNRQFGQMLGEEKEKKGLKEEKFSGSIPNIDTSKSLPVFNKITGAK